MNNDIFKDGPGNEPDWEPPIDVMMEQLAVEKAPASLSRRLKRIPREQRRKENRWAWLVPGPFPRWAIAPAFAVVPLLVLAVVLLQPRQPASSSVEQVQADPTPVEQARVEQARQDLAVAFAYLDKVGYRAGNEIRTVLGNELRHSVKDKLSEHMPFTEQSLKEETT